MRHMRYGPAMAAVLLSVLFAVGFTFGPARAAERERLVAFLGVTGFDVALDSIALSAADAPAMLGREESDFGSDWTRVAEEAFDETLMRDMALDILEEELDEELLAHAAEFYASPLGQRLVEAENASHMIEDTEAHQQDGTERIARMVAEGDPRLAVLRRLMRAIQETGNAVRATQEIQIRFLMAASDAGVLERRLDEAALRAFMKESETGMRIAMRKAALANAAETYSDFRDSEIRAYAEALEDQRMQEVYELMNAVQYEIMAARFEVLAVRMADLHPGTAL
ncbi:hypothetical protein DQW77_17050 [Roseovarius sp. TE539]|uniref:DUF2059 domain-containing protein n=1 Tax=Roseovarius sp. TE539 TaxID=2249812 RepID=UPI000DE01B93|nr:DUF2059 domain-containing protein [Roseovarius sp. TE539]RBI67906.1 hypothetical protein DQW77_17050 [Roseovarius sp. TE539]